MVSKIFNGSLTFDLAIAEQNLKLNAKVRT